MNKVMKRAAACSLVLALAVSGAGCKKNSQETSKGTEEMPKELTVWSSLGSVASKVCKTNNDIKGFQLLEKETGCHINWIHPTKGSEEEKFNLMMASGELPDIICYDWSVVSDGAVSYVDDGYILDMTDYIENDMPDLKAFNDEHPEIAKQYYTDDGKAYYVPFIRGDSELKVYVGPLIRKDWLDKLGLEEPKTTEDLYNVLKAFKTQDPNGNGKADEIPMAAALFKQLNHGVGNLLWAFGTHYDFYTEDGKVKYGVLEDEFEEGLKYIVKLFSEGLIDPDYVLLDRTKMDSKITADKVGFAFGFQPTKVMNAMADVDPNFNWKGIDWLTGPDGKHNVYVKDYANDVGYASAAITSSCKNPSGAAKWLNTLYSKKGREYMNFGEEGKSFNYVDNEPIISDYILNNPDGKDLDTMKTLEIAAAESSFPTIQDWRYYKQILHPAGEAAISTWLASADISGIMPKISFTAEEDRTISKIMGQISTYTDEEVNKIVIGESSVDNIKKIKENVKKMGVDEVLKIYQDAYERYNKR